MVELMTTCSANLLSSLQDCENAVSVWIIMISNAINWTELETWCLGFQVVNSNENTGLFISLQVW